MNRTIFLNDGKRERFQRVTNLVTAARVRCFVYIQFREWE
jgi:hypothetical protein